MPQVIYVDDSDSPPCAWCAYTAEVFPGDACPCCWPNHASAEIRTWYEACYAVDRCLRGRLEVPQVLFEAVRQRRIEAIIRTAHTEAAPATTISTGHPRRGPRIQDVTHEADLRTDESRQEKRPNDAPACPPTQPSSPMEAPPQSPAAIQRDIGREAASSTDQATTTELQDRRWTMPDIADGRYLGRRGPQAQAPNQPTETTQPITRNETTGSTEATPAPASDDVPMAELQAADREARVLRLRLRRPTEWGRQKTKVGAPKAKQSAGQQGIRSLGPHGRGGA